MYLYMYADVVGPASTEPVPTPAKRKKKWKVIGFETPKSALGGLTELEARQPLIQLPEHGRIETILPRYDLEKAYATDKIPTRQGPTNMELPKESVERIKRDKQLWGEGTKPQIPCYKIPQFGETRIVSMLLKSPMVSYNNAINYLTLISEILTRTFIFRFRTGVYQKTPEEALYFRELARWRYQTFLKQVVEEHADTAENGFRLTLSGYFSEGVAISTTQQRHCDIVSFILILALLEVDPYLDVMERYGQNGFEMDGEATEVFTRIKSAIICNPYLKALLLYVKDKILTDSKEFAIYCLGMQFMFVKTLVLLAKCMKTQAVEELFHGSTRAEMTSAQGSVWLYSVDDK
eukprot:GHVQ01011182.1.p1 GENE.GHVQ01011182.1~~GHVQ01011182.1.p1  ORF type:complete len:349 (+),score=27.45 GHVQ01011182.1:307-1353(+)